MRLPDFNAGRGKSGDYNAFVYARNGGVSMNFSDELKELIAKRRAEFPPIDMRDQGNFFINLIFVWQYIIASTDLTLEALNQTESGQNFTDIRKEYCEFLRYKLDDERDHDQWLRDDLHAVGIEVKAVPNNVLAAEIVGNMFYMIRYVNPLALLGYMAVLEGTPVPLDVVMQLENVHGVEVCRTLRYHAVHDVEHAFDLFQIVDIVPENKREFVIEAAVRTLDYFKLFSQSITKSQEQNFTDAGENIGVILEAPPITARCDVCDGLEINGATAHKHGCIMGGEQLNVFDNAGAYPTKQITSDDILNIIGADIDSSDWCAECGAVRAGGIIDHKSDCENKPSHYST